MKTQNDNLENEIWINHPLGIMVSNMGRVWTRYKGKHFGHKGSTPYLQVNWQRKLYQVHRLICEAFKENPDNLPTVDHIDRNPLNNRVENLRWPDYSTQIKNREVAEKLSKPILQLNKNMEIVKEWKSSHQAEREGGFNQGNITKCCKGRLKTCGGFKWTYA